jgi:hypothetical protein
MISKKVGDNNDLLIITSSRSGSTWLVESLLKKESFLLYNQPFDNFFNRSLFIPKVNDFPSKDPHYFHFESKQIFKKRFTRIFSNQIFPNIEWRVWLKSRPIFYDRKLIKCFFVKQNLEVMLINKNIDFLILMRHPINTSLSNIEYGYKPSALYLLEAYTVETFPQINQIKILHEKYSNFILIKYLISWVLENWPIRNSQIIDLKKEYSNLFFVSYEELLELDKNNSVLVHLPQYLQDFEMNRSKSKTAKIHGKIDKEAIIKNMFNSIPRSDLDIIENLISANFNYSIYDF